MDATDPVVAEHPKRIESLHDYIELVTPIQENLTLRFLYRGEPLMYDTTLTPKIYRKKYQKHFVVGVPGNSDGKSFYAVGPMGAGNAESQTLRNFKRLAQPYLTQEPQGTWDWLALAQHYGLATRLLDWSTNPLVALYFAVEPPNDAQDSIVWQLSHRGQHARATFTSTSGKKTITGEKELPPFEIEEVCQLTPPLHDPRVLAQASVFTAHPPDHSMLTEYRSGSLLRISISGTARPRLRWQLAVLGITRASLFPGLDGIATFLNQPGTFPEP